MKLSYPGLVVPWIVLSLFICIVHGSAGDRLPEFKNCVLACADVECESQQGQIPFYLRVLQWDCHQDCDYKCQQHITGERVEKGEEIYQFHGKWPFVRVFGIQELASVVFSMFNFVPHYRGYQYIKRSYHDDERVGIYLRKYYLTFAVVGMNSWVWSSVFHTRDFLVTERFDYFSAILTILYGFFTANVRLFRLDRPEKVSARNFLILVCVIAYACHVGYLTLINFSYSYNMLAGVIVGLTQNALWIVLSIKTYRSLPTNSDRMWALQPAVIVLAITAGMSFEVLDFPPMGWLVDAHALWHLATVLPTYWWYEWMDKDLQYLKSEKFRP
jgi:post-GPI attachment to proteins factor 3